MRIRTVLVALTLALPMACTEVPGTMSFLSPTADGVRPAMRWDHRPEAAEWTAETLQAVAQHDAELAAAIPADIERWCPGYEEASLPERRAFWAGLLSATAKHESTWNPRAAGGGGKYIGLMQISPSTARTYGCEANSAGELKDGAENLSCAVKIMARQVDRDAVVAGGGAHGVGRDWMPFRKAAKRQDIATWTRQQSYCQG